jgi:hypothetical protein
MNIKEGGSNGKHSLETRKLISESNTGKRHSHQSKVRMSMSQKGRVVTKEHRMKISNTLKGNKLSEETKAKISQRHIGKRCGMNNSNAKEVTIQNINTNEIVKGSLSQLARQYGFSRDCMRKYNKSQEWKLVTSSTNKEKTNDIGK